MVSRKRDYALERERRNIRAKALGFSSLDALDRARRRGEYPTVKQLRESPEARERAKKISAQLVKKRKAEYVPPDPKIARIRDEIQRWSDIHSKQAGTKYNKRWGDKRVIEFYEAFVRDWRVPGDERNFDPTYKYMRKYRRLFSYVPELDRDPYAS